MNAIERIFSTALIAVSLLLVGCTQSPEDRIYEAFKCGKAATMLGHEKEAAQAIAAVESDLQEIADESSMARYAMELSGRFQEDVPLYRYSAGDQLAALQAIFKTDTCQSLYAPSTLNLSNGSVSQPEATEPGRQPVSDAAPQAELRATPEAVLKIARQYVADAQGALLPNSVVAYCKAFSAELAQPQDLQDCLRLVDVPTSQANELPTPANAEAILGQAANLPLVPRFAYCTSDPVLRYIASFADYDRCMPESFDSLLTRELSQLKDMAEQAAGVGPPAFPYNDPLWAASQLTKDERVAYCGIPAVREQLQSQEQRDCLDGKQPDDETPPEAPPSAQQAVDGVARSVLLKAALIRSQEEREAFCSRQHVRALLTPTQLQECRVGLSPDNPPEGVTTDDDPGYRDEN